MFRGSMAKRLLGDRAGKQATEGTRSHLDERSSPGLAGVGFGTLTGSPEGAHAQAC